MVYNFIVKIIINVSETFNFFLNLSLNLFKRKFIHEFVRRNIK